MVNKIRWLIKCLVNLIDDEQQLNLVTNREGIK